MKCRYYVSQEGIAILEIVTELGTNELTISVGNNRLDWHSIKLSSGQSEAFKQFMRENDV